ncbi:hypothetical protein LTR56_022423 [Elasticomyces elasticus]|nr:hypothetical protein LTR56_022423 [Elasticomyces elasticus]KAK3633014.1 hypothetical protein LTR22_020332 [Elasticomyces elasticus]KAK4932725.1 hypothetical protein LTR49_001149 [Elasticomyces elasticus]KAK5769748.1 hypothetical protein LTS12_000198 [Elasticomyces elasticus]
MASSFLPNLDAKTLAVSLGVLAVLSSGLYYLFSRPPFPKNAPGLTPEAFPIIGSLQFFTERWDFFQRAMANAHGGNFSFYAGQHPVIGVAGEEARKVFFESKSLAFSEGYAAMLGGSPNVKKEGDNNNLLAEDVAGGSDFGAYFNKRLINMVKGPQLKKGLPLMLRDARASLDRLAADPAGVTDPFDSIYRLVFQFTMRTVACNEIADDPKLLEQCLKHFERVEQSATPWQVMYPWMPLWSKVQRTRGGAQLYMIFKAVVDARRKNGIRGDDALQYLIDQGDDITHMLMFVLGALFAGQLNSGINAAWVLTYLANNHYWLDRMREEISSVAERYCSDSSLPLKDKLMHVPIEAWESEFPLADMCLKDSIRLQALGCAFRKNVSDHDVPLNKAGTEVVPPNAYVAFAVGEVHYDPNIYEKPDEWDPSRYMPERAEDKKATYGWMGWGVARHPCLGMRFAKLEMNVILAFFVAYFDDFTLSDAQGNKTTRLPATDKNHHTAHKPAEKVYIKYKAKA